MTEAEARQRIVSFGQCEADPVITAGEIDMLVDMAKIMDRYQIWPTSTSWTPTYDTNFAIAQAWLLKAGRVSMAYLYMSGGKMLSRQQMYDHSMKLYRTFANKARIKSIHLVQEWPASVESQVELASSSD